MNMYYIHIITMKVLNKGHECEREYREIYERYMRGFGVRKRKENHVIIIPKIKRIF